MRCARAPASRVSPAAHDGCADWLARADYMTPFDFFATALGPEGGRARLLERLGHEAGDPIDELLARALQYQRAEGRSLQGFLHWFETGGGEIKRDLEQNRRREVRILTVHAAKGLQAPIVYLPDTTRVPRDGDRMLRLHATARRVCGCRAPTTPTTRRARLARARPRERALRGAEPPALRRHDARRGPALRRRLATAPESPTAAAGTSASTPACAASSDAGSASSRRCRAAAPCRAASTSRCWPASAAGRATAMSSPMPAVSRCPSRPSWRCERRLPLADWVAPAGARSSRTRPCRWRRRSRCRTRGPPDRAPSARCRPARRERWQRGRLMHELLRASAVARRRPAVPRLPGASWPSRPTGSRPRRSRRGATEALAVTEAPAHAALFADELARRGAADRHRSGHRADASR